MPQAATTSTSRLPAALSATPEVRFSRGIRAATIAQAEGGVLPSWNEEDLSFEFVLASETPCRSYRYSADGRECVEVEEVLSMDGLQDVDKLVGASILDQHNTYSLLNVYGVITEARIEGTQLVCRGRLWDREDIAHVVDGVRKGILRNFSVGFERHAETFEERAGKPPLVTVTSWQGVEGSIVTVPADPTAQTRAAGAKPTPKGVRRTPSPTAAQRTAAMATKPTKAQRAAAAEAVSEAEAALAIAESNVDEARKAAGLPARAKRDEMPASGDDGEREGDAENQEDGEGGDAGATAEKDEKKRAAAAAAEKRSALVEGLRTVARRRGKEALEDFEAIAAAGGSLDELRAAAVAAVRSKAAPITSTAGGVHAPNEAPALRSFRDSAIGKRNAR